MQPRTCEPENQSWGQTKTKKLGNNFTCVLSKC